MDAAQFTPVPLESVSEVQGATRRSTVNAAMLMPLSNADNAEKKEEVGKGMNATKEDQEGGGDDDDENDEEEVSIVTLDNMHTTLNVGMIASPQVQPITSPTFSSEPLGSIDNLSSIHLPPPTTQQATTTSTATITAAAPLSPNKEKQHVECVYVLYISS